MTKSPSAWARLFASASTANPRGFSAEYVLPGPTHPLSVGRSGLKAVPVIHRLLGVGGRLQESPLVGLQDLEPARNGGGVVLANLGREAQVGAQQGRPHLGHGFLARIAVVAKLRATKVPVEPR